MKKYILFPLLFLSFGISVALTSCGPMKLGSSDDDLILKEEYRAADKVQGIVAGQDNPSDKSLRGQYSYTVGPDRRLLVIYTFAQELVQKAETRRGKMILRIAVDHSSTQGRAVDGLKVAPLLRSWVLGSTWTRFNGFMKGKNSEWSAPGGDLDWVGLQKGTRQKPKPLPGRPRDQSGGSTTTTTSSTSSTTSTSMPEVFEYVYFDITDWFLNYVKGKGANYGFAITSSQEYFTIYGELSGTLGPVIIWHEL